MNEQYMEDKKLNDEQLEKVDGGYSYQTYSGKANSVEGLYILAHWTDSIVILVMRLVF